MSAYYNEFDPAAAAWLRWLIDNAINPVLAAEVIGAFMESDDGI